MQQVISHLSRIQLKALGVSIKRPRHVAVMNPSWVKLESDYGENLKIFFFFSF